MNDQAKRVAIIGGGISGIAAANVFQKNNFQPVIFEKSESIGGIWALSYPNVRLQNTRAEYHISDFPWPSDTDLHPTSTQILNYLNGIVERLQLDLRLQHKVLELKEQDNGWMVRYENEAGTHEAFFDYVAPATGQYSERKYRPEFAGEASFKGQIITERDVKDLNVFKDKRVAVVGFGKSALDMVDFASPHASKVHHIFRRPSWTIHRRILGVYYVHLFFPRMSSIMMTCWGHPTGFERFLHKRLPFMVKSFWGMINSIFRYKIKATLRGKDQAARERIDLVTPKHPLLNDLRSAVALAPEHYYAKVADGEILPYHAGFEGFSADGVRLSDGREVPCDLAVLSLGSKPPTFPYFPQHYRDFLEAEKDGVQLYRHLIHPKLRHVGFIGFNHGFLHVPEVEIGTQWLCALWKGDLELPAERVMEQHIETIRQWKRDHIQFEPARSCAINTRYQQYLDTILKELGVSPYRKLPNPLAEVFIRYRASDYKGVVEAYLRKKRNGTPRKSLPVVM